MGVWRWGLEMGGEGGGWSVDVRGHEQNMDSRDDAGGGV